MPQQSKELTFVMNQMKIFLTTFILFCFSIGFAQKSISGKVLEVATDEPIPFANVFFEGTTIGTTTDFDGEFTLSTKDVEDATVLSVSSIGYQPTTIVIGSKKGSIVVKLETDEVQIEVVEIVEKRRKLEKDTTALKILTNVIKNKDNNRMKEYDYYQYNAYTKTQFDLYNVTKEGLENTKILSGMDVAFQYVDSTENGNTFLPVLFKESISDVYYKKNNNVTKEEVLAEQFSGVGNKSISQLIDAQFESIDIYDNLIIIAGKSFIGPFANGAKTVYHYTFADSMIVDGRMQYELYFIGKSLKDLAFKGKVTIDKPTYAVKNIELRIGDKTNINWLNDFYTYQSFELIDEFKNQWFIDKEISNQAVGFSKKEEALSFRVTRDVSRDSIILNKAQTEEFYRGDPIVYKNNAGKQTEEFWVESRHDTLSQQDADIYTMVDSVKNTKKYKTLEWLVNFALSANARVGPVDFGRWYQLVSWNDIEGVRFRLGMSTNKDLSKKFYLGSHIAYGTKDKLVKYSFNGFTHLKRDNFKLHSLEAAYKFDYTRLGVIDDPLLFYDNFFNSLLSTGAIDDLMRIRQGQLKYTREWVSGVTTTAQFAHKEFQTIPGRFEFIKTDEMGGVTDFGSVTSSEFEVGLILSKGEQYIENEYSRFSLGSKKPIVTFTYTAGVEGLFGSDNTFHKIDFNLKHRLSVPFGYSKYQIFFGRIFGDVPYPLLEFHNGNQGFLYNKRAYNLMNGFEFASDYYGAFWFDHHFDGFIMNKIPGINKLQLRFLITSKFLLSDIRNPNNTDGNAQIDFPRNNVGELLLEPAEPFYSEIGFGFENILKVGRIDFLFRPTQIGKPEVKKFWFKIAFQPKF